MRTIKTKPVRRAKLKSEARPATEADATTFELWQRSSDGRRTALTKRANGAFRVCLGTALRSKAGAFEIWNSAGIRQVTFTVGGGERQAAGHPARPECAS